KVFNNNFYYLDMSWNLSYVNYVIGHGFSDIDFRYFKEYMIKLKSDIKILHFAGVNKFDDDFTIDLYKKHLINSSWANSNY
ncbi:MAG: hypothetical protein R3Y52_03150, partial [Psittacicella sp.]